MSKRNNLLISQLVLISFFFISCDNKNRVNAYTLIINTDSVEFYKHPLENKDDLKSTLFSKFNATEFINKNGIKKTDTISIKILEGAECLSKAVTLGYLFETEGLSNVSLKKFDSKEGYILGYKNFILFDTNQNLQLSVPKEAK
jgi:hypothetical protein